MTTVRLAVLGSKLERRALTDRHSPLPAILVSHFYIKGFDRAREAFVFRDWVMDSGAFSAHSVGIHVDLDEYIDACRVRLESDPLLSEVYSLDVIGDHKASLENWLAMKAAGIPAIPTFHLGSPWAALDELRDAPKIALGGMVGKGPSVKDEFIGQCFARVWPKRLHGFGLQTRKLLAKYPFHSVDASSWAAASQYGRWKAYPGMKTGRGPSKDLSAEVDFYLRLERQLQSRWKREMALLEQTT